MKKLKRYALLLVLAFVALTTTAQPTYHDSYMDVYFSVGAQHFLQPTGPYTAGTFQMEALYSFAGGKAGISYGPDYLSFSPVGILWFTPALLMDGMNNSPRPAAALFIIAAIGTLQIHIPLGSYFEMTFGWDAFKFTRLKNFSDTYYVHGSLNAGLNFFITDELFLSAYYEYNHTHNPIMKMMGGPQQPSELVGHSFGARFGVML